ncbi:MAG TPA: 2-oxoglutarate dehydrogenase E1 component, partial [Opitutaceae bacterium]
MSLPTRANSDVIEAAYNAWLDNPDSVDPTWRAFFQGFTLGNNGGALLGAQREGGVSIVDSLKQAQVHSLIYHYRAIGHTQAHLDPLNPPPPPASRLALSEFGLSEADLDTAFDVGHYLQGGQMKLRDLIASLEQTYSGKIGVEYIHIQDTEIRRWLQERMEPTGNRPAFNKPQKVRILRRLLKAELFEKFLHTRFVGQKRFSLEGGETMIAAFDALIEQCPQSGVDEVVMGMAHRGRLSVLSNILRKSFDVLFEQFSENYIPESVAGDGDVKYHLGYEAELKTASGKNVEVRLAANPSHLEIVDPVVEGKARARQRIRGDTERRRVLPFLVHGDAAFAGQGVVAETLNFSQLPGYRTGGTIHFIINNQIGFTTLPSDARSTRYCTDVAKMIEAPIFHVNGDDAEAVCHVMLLALEFRLKFQRDVVIDMYCYRKHGHNESDEPAFTQPVLYKKIAAHPLISSMYAEKLISEGTITQADADAIKAEYTAAMETAFEKAKAKEARKKAADPAAKFKESTAIFQPGYNHAAIPTGASPELVTQVVHGLTKVPPNFHVNPKIKRFLEARIQAHKEGGPVDWGFGEALAFGTLLCEGTPVRLSGQDCERGTFSHRHAVLYDYETREKYVPLLNLDEKQERFCVYNSLLSEAAVLGFDYGYSMDYPRMLCIWEAQFGDFANGAQVVIDQFLASSESKWQRVSGMVLLLPHGYEGQGPDHTSARIERWLNMAADEAFVVAQPSTPASYFHLLRQHSLGEEHRPLIVFTPKSMLKRKEAASQPDDFTTGEFRPLITDEQADPEKVDTLLLCSGRVTWDLMVERAKHEDAGRFAIARVEQLYPRPEAEIAAEIAR